MAITMHEQTYTGSAPRIWRGECKILPGGFRPQQEFPVGTVIKRGTLVQIDATDLTANIVKSAKVIKGGTTTAPRVQKDNLFQVGDFVSVGDKIAKIKSVNHSEDGYDVVTFEAALTGLKPDDILVECKDESTADAKFEANAVIGADKKVSELGVLVLDVAYDAVVLRDVVPSFPSDWLDGDICLKGNHSIKFIRQ